MSQVTLQGNASGTGIFTLAAPNSNTNRTLNLPDAGGDVVLNDATQTLTNKSISGAQINSGTVAVARLGSGTPSASNFLRGDGSWQVVSTTPTTNQVLTATADASYAAVGTYSWMRRISGASATGGNTFSGAQIQTVLQGSGTYGTAPTGTWRAMSGNGETAQGGMLFLRIS